MIPVLIGIVWLVATLVLARLCIKGRRVGSDPHCSRCNFNLVGIAIEPVSPDDKLNTGAPDWAADPTTEILTCTDCGKIHCHPSRLPLGERKPRPRLLATSVLLVLVPLLSVLAVGYRSGWSFNIYKAAPVSLLTSWGLDSDFQRSGNAVDELDKRFLAKGLSDKQLHGIATRVLDRAESYYTLAPELRHEHNFGDGTSMSSFVEHAIKKDLLSSDELQRAFRVSFRIVIPPTSQARPGTMLRTQFWQQNSKSLRPTQLAGLSRIHGGRAWFPVTITEVRADGEPLPWSTPASNAVAPAWKRPLGNDFDYFLRPDIAHPIIELQPGTYTLEWDLIVGPFNPVSSSVTQAHFEDAGIDSDAWAITVTSTLEILPDDHFNPPSLITGFAEKRLLQGDIRKSYPADLQVFIEEPHAAGLFKNQFVPHEIILVLEDKEQLLFYAANHDIEGGYTHSGWFDVEFEDELRDALRADPDAVIILRSTREAARRQFIPLSLRVPPREQVYQYDENGRLQLIGEGLPNPLAIELGLLDENSVPATDESSTADP